MLLWKGMVTILLSESSPHLTSWELSSKVTRCQSPSFTKLLASSVSLKMTFPLICISILMASSLETITKKFEIFKLLLFLLDKGWNNLLRYFNLTQLAKMIIIIKTTYNKNKTAYTTLHLLNGYIFLKLILFKRIIYINAFFFMYLQIVIITKVYCHNKTVYKEFDRVVLNWLTCF